MSARNQPKLDPSKLPRSESFENLGREIRILLLEELADARVEEEMAEARIADHVLAIKGLRMDLSAARARTHDAVRTLIAHDRATKEKTR